MLVIAESAVLNFVLLPTTIVSYKGSDGDGEHFTGSIIIIFFTLDKCRTYRCAVQSLFSSVAMVVLRPDCVAKLPPETCSSEGNVRTG